jgi:hypothetical protein
MFSSFNRTNFSVAVSEFTRSRSRATGQRFGALGISVRLVASVGG